MLYNSTNAVNNTISPYKLLFGYFGIFFTAFGIASNIALLYLFVKDNLLRSNTYRLMMICCISDLIMSLIGFLASSIFTIENLTQSTIAVVCQALALFAGSSYGISIMNLCLIAVDRYFAVVRPLSVFYRIHKKQIAIVTEFFIWIISIAVTTFRIQYLAAGEKGEILCDYPNITKATSVSLILQTVVNYIIPSILILILYWKIIIHQRNYIRPGHPSTDEKQDIMKKRRLIKSLCSISACYILITLPGFTLMIALAITQKSFLDIQHQNSVLYFMCMYAHSTISTIAIFNPLICVKFDANIRQLFRRKMLRCLPISDEVKTISRDNVPPTVSPEV